LFKIYFTLRKVVRQQFICEVGKFITSGVKFLHDVAYHILLKLVDFLLSYSNNKKGGIGDFWDTWYWNTHKDEAIRIWASLPRRWAAEGQILDPTYCWFWATKFSSA